MLRAGGRIDGAVPGSSVIYAAAPEMQSAGVSVTPEPVYVVDVARPAVSVVAQAAGFVQREGSAPLITVIEQSVTSQYFRFEV